MRPRNAWLAVAQIVFAALFLVGVLGSVISNRTEIRQIQQERAARHTATCAAVMHQVFTSTADLRSYEQTIGCPLVGTVPTGGGQPSP